MTGSRTCAAALATVLSLVTAGLAGAAEPIKIGVVTPLSGTYAPIGQQVQWGLQLAAQEINAADGILGRPVELIIEDGEANPAVAVRKAEKLYQTAGVDFLTGMVSSAVTLAVAQVAERNDALAATAVSVSDAITGSQCSPNVFRVNAPGGMQATGLAAWLQQTMPKARIFAVGPDYEMGHSTVSSFIRATEDKGLNVLGKIFPPLGAKDYSTYFGQIRSARPDVIYTSVAGNDTVRLFTQLTQYGLAQQLQLVGASVVVTSQNIGAVGDAAEGFVTVSGYSPDIDTAANRRFVQDFKEAFGAEPDLYGAASYGLLYLYKAAVEKAGTTDTDAVRKAMEGLSWETPQGTKTMRAGDHQAVMPMYVLEVNDGRFTIIDRISGEKAIGPDRCERF